MEHKPKGGLSVILLEDNRQDAELVHELLSSEGFDISVTQCDCETSFTSALAGSNPDLIISDFSLPSYTGRRALTLAKSLRPKTPFIFFSGTIGEEAAIDALKDGATDYVLKQRPKRLIAAIRRALADAEERAKSEEAHETVRDLAQLLDLATDAIIVRDLDDRIQFVNQGAERLYGFSRHELVGRKSTEFMPPSVAAQFEEVKRTTVRDGHWEGEMEQYTKSMQPILVTSRWTLVRNRPNRPDRILAIHTDITEKKQLEKQFLRAQRLESVGILASGIAHDLNNVLAPIMMATELLRQGKLPAEDAPMLTIIDQSARRGAEIVKQVLTFVRGSEGKRSRLSVAPLIKELSKIARETFPRNIRTEFHLDHNLWEVHGDAGQLHQVLMNLCVNARDAMPEGGTLKLSAQNSADPNAPQLLIKVEDTGTGITPEVLEKMFDPFFTTKELQKGTGLGLSTVMGIVKSHGGTIEVSSTVGAGTCFSILLPAHVTSGTSSESPRVSAPRGRGELILLVDDEPELRKVTAQTLVHHGYEVVTAADGNEGVLRFTEHLAEIRLVVTDIMMPGIDGASFAKTIRKLKPDVKIIATTGQAEREIPEAAVHLKKPFSPNDLLQAVFEILQASHHPGI